ncbi:hypothetical protein [Evansella tamaricis]|uniref:WYL domain-containing protein n=1 Tax=Evansella tamaricis TaxID=2069301 RepID=A0ABS6J993_9BACI|nr:hypothetical protein [Evansella tamaricis]MBU9710252.1 hypothetical protein [Evansella tamaricis]
METIIERSRITGRPVELMYLSQKGIVTKRTVSVDRYNENFIIGFCHLRQAYRRFNRKNILALFPVREYKGAGRYEEA